MNFVDDSEETSYQTKELDLGQSTNHPFYSNLWYRDIKAKVRKITKASCYACSMLMTSTEITFPHIAVPLTSESISMTGVPTLCILVFQFVIQSNHLLTAYCKVT